MIAFLDQIVTWHEFIDDTETHAILGDATFAIDIGPWKAGQHVNCIQLASEDNGEGQVFLEEVAEDGTINNRCEVIMVVKPGAILKNFTGMSARHIAEMKKLIEEQLKPLYVSNREMLEAQLKELNGYTA